MNVDIIMPAYNPDHHIVEAIDSCLSQSYKNVKLTIIDDCSTSDIEYLKKKYPMVNFLKTNENMGPAGARNFGIQNTSGHLVSFLDSDDIMHRDKIFHSVDAFKKNTALGMTCGNYRIFVNGRVKNPFYSRPPKINLKNILIRNYIASGSVTVKREVFDDVGCFDERFWIAEDLELWTRILEKYEAKYIHRVLYFYRVQPGGNSLTQRSDIQKDHIKNLEIIRRESKMRTSLCDENI